MLVFLLMGIYSILKSKDFGYDFYPEYSYAVRKQNRCGNDEDKGALPTSCSVDPDLKPISWRLGVRRFHSARALVIIQSLENSVVTRPDLSSTPIVIPWKAFEIESEVRQRPYRLVAVGYGAGWKLHSLF